MKPTPRPRLDSKLYSELSIRQRDASSRKLHLARETLRRLSTDELARIAGGGGTTRTCTCPPTTTDA